jgi:tellurite resistance protein
VVAVSLKKRNAPAIFERLLEDRDVQRINEQLEAEEGKAKLGVRRRLLSTSVRLSRAMAPDLHRIADDCIEKLGVDIPLELYVFASPSFNAACVKPEDGRLFIMFSSSLLEAFEAPELKFVMGHELGHHLFQHHDIPIGYILRGSDRPSPKLALQLTSWSRFAEISADRAGAHCANDLEAVARSLFKLASGLSGGMIEFSLEDFLAQVDEMQLEDSEPGLGAPAEDWFLTHPFSPLRVKALKLFHESVLSKPDGMSVDQLELLVQELLGLMEPSYLESRTDTAEVMRRLLFAAAIVVAGASDGISEDEISTFEEFFGADSFSERLNLDKLKAELDERVGRARDATSVVQRMQVLRDLCVVARADGGVTNAEMMELRRIARQLSVPSTLIDMTLECATELD